MSFEAQWRKAWVQFALPGRVSYHTWPEPERITELLRAYRTAPQLLSKEQLASVTSVPYLKGRLTRLPFRGVL